VVAEYGKLRPLNDEVMFLLRSTTPAIVVIVDGGVFVDAPTEVATWAECTDKS